MAFLELKDLLFEGVDESGMMISYSVQRDGCRLLTGLNVKRMHEFIHLR
jgi:hypothetical protein